MCSLAAVYHATALRQFLLGTGSEAELNLGSKSDCWRTKVWQFFHVRYMLIWLSGQTTSGFQKSDRNWFTKVWTLNSRIHCLPYVLITDDCDSLCLKFYQWNENLLCLSWTVYFSVLENLILLDCLLQDIHIRIHHIKTNLACYWLRFKKRLQ
jgi:hypothetical protein